MKKLWIGITVGAILLVGFVYSAREGVSLSLERPGSEAGVEAVEEAPILPVIEANKSIIVEAQVLPYRNASLSMSSGGVVAEVLVAEGDVVTEGTPLVRLRSARQEAALAQAEANMLNAELSVAEIIAPARAEEITRAQAAVTLAQANLQKVLDGATNADTVVAQSGFASAEASLRQAQAEYDKVSWRSDIGMLPQATVLQQATNELQAAQARLDDLLAGPTQADIVRAQAEVSAAQADLDLVRAGARTETVAAAEARVDAARAVVQDARAALDEMTLVAPFAATVADLHVEVGEQVSPGTSVIQIADISKWRVETADLTELDVVNVRSGDPVEVTIDALPDVTLSGRVTYIRPIGENKQGDITYTVLIDLAEQTAQLRWNMTAQTTILPDAAARAAALNPAMPAQSENQESLSAISPASGVGLAADLRAVLEAERAELDLNSVREAGQSGRVRPGVTVNLRSGPSTDSVVLSQLSAEQRLTVADRSADGSWLRVELDGGAAGWVAAEFVLLSGESMK